MSLNIFSAFKFNIIVGTYKVITYYLLSTYNLINIIRMLGYKTDCKLNQNLFLILWSLLLKNKFVGIIYMRLYTKCWHTLLNNLLRFH